MLNPKTLSGKFRRPPRSFQTLSKLRFWQDCHLQPFLINMGRKYKDQRNIQLGKTLVVTFQATILNLGKGHSTGPNHMFFLTLFKRPLTDFSDFSKVPSKKCVNTCRDKCVKIVSKSLGKMSNLPKKSENFTFNL